MIVLSRLTRDEEEIYLLRIENGDVEAKKEFMKHHFGLVEWYSHVYSKEPAYSSEDLFQEGMIILLDTIKKYDMSSQAKFSTYFYTRLKWRFKDMIDIKSEIVKGPRSSQLKNGIDRKAMSVVSLDGMLANNGASLDLFQGSIDFGYEKVENAIISNRFLTRLKRLLEPRDYYIMYCILVLDLRQKEIGKTLGLSESRIFQLVKRNMEVIENNLDELYSDNVMLLLSYKN